jgi:hypothetical protein
MNEASALDVVAVRSIETTDRARTLWTDDDRSWASRAAAEIVGAQATADEFVARRAMLALEKLASRQRALARSVRALRWRPWVGGALIAVAFALGLLIDQIDRTQRINILAPPVLALLVWNLVVYLVIAAGYVIRYGDDAALGPLRRAIVRVAGGLARPRRGGGERDAIVALFDDWSQRSAPLYGVRAARILHFAAAALAVGVIAGLYLRGIAFEYRASWESTFLDANAVRSIVALAYAPGAALTGIAVPGADAIAAIRSPAGENAARWLHLIAATVVVVVVAPRLLLAVTMGIVERHRAAHFPLPLDEPYFQRLLRGYRGGPARVRVIPYSYTLAPAAIAGLEAVIARAFGGSAALTIGASVAYGSDEPIPAEAMRAAGTTVIALFNASATPEREVHATFLETLAHAQADGTMPLALIDESTWTARWRHEPARIADRRSAWRSTAGEAGVPAVFVDLAAPDLAAVEEAVDVAVAAAER